MTTRAILRATYTHITRPTNSIRYVQNASSLELSNNHRSEVEPGEAPLNPFDTVGPRHKAFLNELRVPQKRSFNLASYVNESKTLRDIFKIGVSLYDIERTKVHVAERYKHLEFDRDCAPKIRFLVDSGLKPRNLGRFITEYPEIFFEDIENLKIRLNFLEHKGFTKSLIIRALNKSAHILSHKTKFTDFKLGLLQVELNLKPITVINMVSKHPELIAIPGAYYKLAYFTLREEFGFTDRELVKIVEAQPNLIDVPRNALFQRLDLIHNTIGLSHETIVKFPKLITGPINEMENRFRYLQKLKRDQFDPSKPLYVPPNALYSMSDEDFCFKHAKTSLDDYILFTKSR